MAFRIKIITPLRASDGDLQRRQRRYEQQVGSETRVRVVNIADGPETLDNSGDLLSSDLAVYQEGMKTCREQYDAVLVDCVFEPAVKLLRAECPVPTFGPMGLTLPIVTMIADSFSFVVRSERHKIILAELTEQYGYQESLCSIRSMGISYQMTRDQSRFGAALERAVGQVVEDGAGAVVLGSTTWEVTDKTRESAGIMPVLMPGMRSVRILEHLWQDKLLETG